jgi:hypothetical protein
VEKNSKTISHFCGLFGVAVGSTALLQFFQKIHSFTLIGNLESLGERKTKGKRKREPGQRVECTLFYFIFNRLICQIWRFLPKF